MGDRIVLRTAYRDNGDAIGALARELEAGDLVLVADHSVEPGAWVAFDVLLTDGQSFFEGMGRCVRSQPTNGAHRVRLSDLQLDVAGELLFERIVMAREDLEHGGRTTGSIDISRLAEAAMPEVAAPPPLPRPASAVPRPAVPRPTPPIPRPASGLPSAPRPPSVLPSAPHPASALPVPRPASVVPLPRPPVAVPRPASAVPPRALASPPRTPSVRPRPPSVVPTSPGGFPAVRPPSELPGRGGAAPSSSGLPPAPRVPTFAPLPFAATSSEAARRMPARTAHEPAEDTSVTIESPAGSLPDLRSREPAVSGTSAPRSAERASRLPTVLDARLQSLLPRLVAEGRVRDLEELRALALRIGLDALDTVYPDG